MRTTRLPGTPAQALAENRGTEVKRRAQAAGVLTRRAVRQLSYLAVLAACLLGTAPLEIAAAYPGLPPLARLAARLLPGFVLGVGWDLYAITPAPVELRLAVPDRAAARRPAGGGSCCSSW